MKKLLSDSYFTGTLSFKITYNIIICKYIELTGINVLSFWVNKSLNRLETFLSLHQLFKGTLKGMRLFTFAGSLTYLLLIMIGKLITFRVARVTMSTYP